MATSHIPHEGILIQQLRTIFPNQNTHIHARKVSQIKYPATGGYVELDIWIPKFNLAFEFQDPHHYVTTWYTSRPLETIQQKDRMKEYLVRNHGLTLIVIPCWWDAKAESLKADLYFYRPDLFINKIPSTPISLNPSRSLLSFKIPGIGELMSALFPMDTNFSNTIPNKTWWMGEKYDGVRFCWNSNMRRVYTRFCNELSILPGIISSLPQQLFIDGELWFGRGKFSFASLLANRSKLVPWEALRIPSFDVPEEGYHDFTFEDRYTLLLHTIANDHSICIVVPRTMVRDTNHLRRILQKILEDEGEGVIMRKIGSKYERGKSSSLIKFKSAQGDREAIVVRIDSHSVILALPDGTNFPVASQHVLIPTPSVGDIVTFSFDNRIRKEVPVNPKITRLRTDLVWEEVILNFYQDKKLLNEHSIVDGLQFQRTNSWSSRNARLFLEKIANSKKMNPLLPSTWYQLYSYLIQFPKGRTFLRKFKGGYIRALEQIFPEIQFDHNEFNAKWHELANRRKFFENFARKHSFNHVNPNNWYLIPVSKLMATKGTATVLAYHEGSLSKALISLFPEIGLNQEGFREAAKEKIKSRSGLSHQIVTRMQTQKATSPAKIKETIIQAKIEVTRDWKDIKERENFFISYAREMEFDYRSAIHWKSQNFSRIMSREGAQEVAAQHEFSLRKALLSLFPDIGLDQISLIKSTMSDSDRRKFFEDYAESKGFDSLLPSNWYSIPLAPILDVPGAYQVVHKYERSVRKALIALFPEIGLDPSKFYRYNDPQNRKAFFEAYAKKHGFDPLVPNNWYSWPLSRIILEKGGPQVISYYNHSVKQSLVSLFPDIGLDKSKFISPPTQLCKDFFENFANEHKFDPLLPSNWYYQSLRKITSSKGMARIMKHYKGNIQKALLDAFPNIGLDPLKFKLTV